VLGVKSTFFADPEPVSVVLVRFGVLTACSRVNVEVDLLEGARDERRIDLRPAKVGSLEASPPIFGVTVRRSLIDDERVRVSLGWGCTALEVGSGGNGRIEFVLSDRGSFEAGMVETAADVVVTKACADSERTASKTLFSDLTLSDRESADFFPGDEVGILSEVKRAREALVGGKTPAESVGFARGKADGLSELLDASEEVGLSKDTSLDSDCRMRFAEFVFPNLLEATSTAVVDLKGLALAGRIKRGAGLPGVPLPAVRGRSKSSRPALEPLRFKDCDVG
jgi:hypothetical protein